MVIHFSLNDPDDFAADVLAAQLGEIGYESFEKAEPGLIAYVQEKLYDKGKLDELISEFPFETPIGYKAEIVDEKNWNEEWEKHFFQPIVIGDQCIIHSSFHQDVPRLKYNIVIDPKMSFGTGHHETTSLMIAEILEADLEGKNILDMGCGTSVLAILASMRGANKLTAIDIDDWCIENSLENARLNGISNIDVLLGDATSLPGSYFDMIFANINRNILLADMDKYADCLPAGGSLYLSGFYTEDIAILTQRASENNLTVEYSKAKNNWAMLRLKKA